MKVYLINLDRRPDRLAEMTARLNALGLEFERISAVDGKNSSIFAHVAWVKAYIYHQMKPPSRGSIGCFLSHRKVWQDMQTNQISQALVLEDDAKVVDWDDAISQIVLADFQLDLLRLEAIDPTGWIDYGFNHQERVVLDRKAVNEMSFGAAAYLITNEGAKKCFGVGKIWFAVDCFDIWVRVVGLRTAVLRPVIFEQSASFSDIQNSSSQEANTTNLNSLTYRLFDQLLARKFFRPLVKLARRTLIEAQTKVK